MLKFQIWNHRNKLHLKYSQIENRQPGLTKICFKEKCLPSGAKTQVKYMNAGTFLLHRYRYILLCFYDVATETYAAVQNSNIRGLSLKVKALSLPYTKPNPNMPDSVNKCKTDAKMYLLMHLCYFNFLICRFELFCQTLITQDSNRIQSSSSAKYVSVLRELPNKLTVYENV